VFLQQALSQPSGWLVLLVCVLLAWRFSRFVFGVALTLLMVLALGYHIGLLGQLLHM
jgi:hypothetical protein